MNGEETKDLVVETAGAPTPLEVQLDSQKAIARIASIAQVIDGCAKVSIQRTNPKDWVRMKHWDKASNGYKESFYLQASGAQKIRGVWGIYFRDRHVTKEVNPDGSYTYLVTGTVGSKVLDQLYGEVVIDIEGGRSSADSFFRGKDGTREPDPMDVRKASIANWEARAVTALLGLKNFSAEDLAKNGIDPQHVSGVEFEAGAEGGGRTDTISEAQQKRLFAIARSAGVSNDELKRYLQVAFKLTSTASIPRQRYEHICKVVESKSIAQVLQEVEQGGAS